MRNFHRLAQGLAVGPLMASIARHPDLWDSDKLRTGIANGPHAEASDIILRFGKPDINDLYPSDDRPAMALLGAKGMALQIMTLVGGSELGRVLVTRLEPGKHILPHADEGTYSDRFDRYHVCLQSLPGNLFRCGDEAISPETSDLWWFNSSIEHEIANNSKDDRITLIVDVRID
jgi:hypothetical protein